MNCNGKYFFCKRESFEVKKGNVFEKKKYYDIYDFISIIEKVCVDWYCMIDWMYLMCILL